MDLLIASPGAVDGIMASLQRQATKLPEPALIAMEKILADARKAKAATPPR
jgi:hypothetical protein